MLTCAAMRACLRQCRTVEQERTHGSTTASNLAAGARPGYVAAAAARAAAAAAAGQKAAAAVHTAGAILRGVLPIAAEVAAAHSDPLIIVRASLGIPLGASMADTIRRIHGNWASEVEKVRVALVARGVNATEGEGGGWPLVVPPPLLECDLPNEPPPPPPVLSVASATGVEAWGEAGIAAGRGGCSSRDGDSGEGRDGAGSPARAVDTVPAPPQP